MVMTDPIADFLTRVRNANTAMQPTVEVPASNIKRNMAEIFKNEGFIKEYDYVEDGKQGIIRMYLKYGSNKEQVITGLKRISKPGLRVYAGKEDIPRVLGGLGTAIISTSKGLMTDRDARKNGLGGEVLCFIW